MKPPLAMSSVRRLVPDQPDRAEYWSRSLWFERFAEPRLKDERRRSFFEHGVALPPNHERPRSWLRFLRHELRTPWDRLLFVQLQARLIVNAGSGTMQNAGLALDRLSGQPFIPGSAIKGCARRNAIDRILEARCELFLHHPPSAFPPESGDLALLVARVVEFLQVFGWAPSDWRPHGDGSPQELEDEGSDIAFACGDQVWAQVRSAAARDLGSWLGCVHSDARPLWKGIPTFAGSARFLPAFPVDVTLRDPVPTPESGCGRLELDLIAAHHRAYHEEVAGFEAAPDIEDPNLIFFPTVAAGHVFVFTVLGTPRPHVDVARLWLKEGLERFGIGAKTAAGYGWMLDVSEIVVPLLGREEDARELLPLAQGFASMTPVEMESKAIEILRKCPRAVDLPATGALRSLVGFLQARRAVLHAEALPAIQMAAEFSSLADERQADVALEFALQHSALLRIAREHLPHTFAPLLAYLDHHKLWP